MCGLFNQNLFLFPIRPNLNSPSLEEWNIFTAMQLSKKPKSTRKLIRQSYNSINNVPFMEPTWNPGYQNAVVLSESLTLALEMI